MYPSISDGDVVLINTLDRTIKNGNVYAFKTDEGARIKRLFKLLDGRVRVSSDNPDKLTYPDEYLTPGMEVQILGKVVHRSGGV
jgi:phage repressor protein C with HTH and peptisase S24 domain